jgi:hypothetical protein
MRYSSPPISALPFDPVRFVCDECGRRWQYRKATLLERFGDVAGRSRKRQPPLYLHWGIASLRCWRLRPAAKNAIVIGFLRL